MRVADVRSARLLDAQPFVRKNELGLIGHSHGGWTAVRAAQKATAWRRAVSRPSSAYYPSCQPQYDATSPCRS